MSDCCSKTCETGVQNNKYQCPVNGKEYRKVSQKTILHHIKEPWLWEDKDQSYFFCDDPECNVVYFGQDNSIIDKSNVREPIGIKEKSGNLLICYCFGVTKDDAVNPEAKTFVMKRTKSQICECEARNPSGKCCLKDFPKS